MILFIGMSSLFGMCMIGNWRGYHASLHCCTPKKSDLEVRLTIPSPSTKTTVNVSKKVG